MAEILLMRHAKSQRDVPLPDLARPLSPRGEKAARRMGGVLTAMGKVPDLILSSPAVRAESTARLAADAGEWDASIEIVDSLYGGGVRHLFDATRVTPNSASRVMLVGHEPTWSMAVASLCGGGDHRMVTAAVACVETAAFAVAGPGSGRLLWMLTPRLFTDGTL